MRMLFDCKKGFTLIEMVITTLILSILMGITMGMVSSSGRMYASGADMSIDKMVGDAVFETIESVAKYATHMEISNSKEKCKNKYQQGFYINTTDTATNSGKLMYEVNNEGIKAKFPNQPYSDGFYQNRTVKYKIEPYTYTHNNNNKTSDRHIIITVIVYRDGQQEYIRTNTIRCVNLGLLGDGENTNTLVTSDKTNAENQYISFSCDEELIMASVDGYETAVSSSDIVTEYNGINNELATKLNNALSEPNLNDDQRKALMESAATTARDEIYILFGGYRPKDIDYKDNNEVLKYFNGVHATKEEVFYGLLKSKFSPDGVVGPSSFPKFKDPNFFKNSVFQQYGENMIQLSLFLMNNGPMFIDGVYNGSQILDYNVYTVQYGKWYDNWDSYKVKFLPLRIEKTTNSVDFSDPQNIYGWTNKGQYSYNKAFAVFHQLKNTWYYEPQTSHDIGADMGIDYEPKMYDFSDKASSTVMDDINSNIVSKYTETVVYFPGTIFEFSSTRTVPTRDAKWNALPAQKIDSSGK